MRELGREAASAGEIVVGLRGRMIGALADELRDHRTS
jgi:hypothetical protein